MSDFSQRFLLQNRDMRGVIVRLHDSYLACLKNHAYPEVVRGYLGEFLCAGALMTSLLKMNVQTTIQAQGQGDVSLLAIEVTPNGTLRGTVKYTDDLSYSKQSSFKELLGEGHLAVIIQPQDEGKESYQGIVELVDENVAKVFEHYFMRSEQLATQFLFKRQGSYVAGLMLQILPDVEFDTEYWQEVEMLLSTISAEELLFDDVGKLLHKIWPQEDINLYAHTPLSFACSCSQERMQNAISLLSYEELIDMASEAKSFDVCCEFCGEKYLIEVETMRRLADKAKSKQVLH